jgi:hypothetical protein
VLAAGDWREADRWVLAAGDWREADRWVLAAGDWRGIVRWVPAAGDWRGIARWLLAAGFALCIVDRAAFTCLAMAISVATPFSSGMRSRRRYPA